MSLFKRGNVYWSYVWEDGIRHARPGTHHGFPQLNPQPISELEMK